MAKTKRGVRLRLLDIQTEIAVIREYAAGLDLAAFLADRGRRRIMQHSLLIISEATRQIPDELTRDHSQIPWHAIRAFGNLLRHEYFNIDPEVVWDTVENHLDDLAQATEAILRQIDAGQ